MLAGSGTASGTGSRAAPVTVKLVVAFNDMVMRSGGAVLVG
jgi:hypothetical protein